MKVITMMNGEVFYWVEATGFNTDEFSKFVTSLLKVHGKYKHLENVVRKDLKVLLQMAGKYCAYGVDIDADMKELMSSAVNIWPEFKPSLNLMHPTLIAVIPFVNSLPKPSLLNSGITHNRNIVKSAFGVTPKTFELWVTLDPKEESEFGLGMLKRFWIRSKTGLNIKRFMAENGSSDYVVSLPVSGIEMYMAMLSEAEALLRIGKIITCGLKTQEIDAEYLRSQMTL
jgi:hypothetical protein